MKKTIIFLCIISLFFIIKNGDDTMVIPNESIRFRIIANSNNINDQLLKMQIRADLIPIFETISSSENIKDSRISISNNIHEIENVVSAYTDDYEIKYGDNYFPTKIFNGITYSAGNYESLVISLGQSTGDNWWCILFPPLCLLEVQKEDLDKSTYDFYFRQIINKYL